MMKEMMDRWERVVRIDTNSEAAFVIDIIIRGRVPKMGDTMMWVWVSSKHSHVLVEYLGTFQNGLLEQYHKETDSSFAYRCLKVFEERKWETHASLCEGYPEQIGQWKRFCIEVSVGLDRTEKEIHYLHEREAGSHFRLIDKRNGKWRVLDSKEGRDRNRAEFDDEVSARHHLFQRIEKHKLRGLLD